MMRTYKSARTACLFFAAAAVPALSYAQGGAQIVRIPVDDGSGSRCISQKGDRVWLTLRRAIVDKKSGWLKEDVTVSFLVIAQMRVSGKNPVSFPLMADATVKQYSNGQVSLPVEFTFIDGLTLKQQSTTYSGADISITIFNQQAKTSWGSALTALSQVAKKLPLPSGPVSDAVSYLMTFGTTALDKDTAKVDLKDQAKAAQISMNFHPDPTGDACPGDFERTGTLAVLQDPPSPTPADAVRITDIDNYCWSADLAPSFVLKAAKKDGNVDCGDVAHYKPAMRQVTNNYVGLVLSAVKSTGTLGASEARTTDLNNARKRCSANKLPAAACGVGK